MSRVRRKLRSSVEQVKQELELRAEAARRELQISKLQTSAALTLSAETARSQAELQRGHRQLQRLFEIAKLLLAYDGDRTLLEVLAQASRAVPLRTVVLIDAAGATLAGAPRLVSCRAAGVPLPALEAAEEQARAALPLGGPELVVSALQLTRVRIADLPAARGEGGEATRATFPLLVDRRPAAGFLQLEVARKPREGELLFLRSVADQLAVAVDRHAARLRDVELRERAEALDRRQKELMAIVSHDLRNPLSAVLLGVSTLVRRGDMAASLRREHLEVMHRAATRAYRLIHDLLDAGRIEAGHLVLSREELHLAPLVQEALELMAPLSAEREVLCRAAACPDLPPVLADRERLLQVFSNLIGNAIKFARPGGRIEVEAHHAEGEVRCAVHDDGPGIEPADLPHVFDRYWQARRDGAGHAGAGAGLGLAIAKGIVDAHGGRIWVESRVGHGSSFVFALPTAPALTTVGSPG